MEGFTHEDQQRIWDEEHRKPSVLFTMDEEDASKGVLKFWDHLESHEVPRAKGLEMACGKGRNVIGLAKKGAEMYGFDFSPAAIEEAQRRAEVAGVTNAHFSVQDATKPWDYESDTFDFAIDCFGSTDIESEEGRLFAASELFRVLKPGGYLFAYLLSTDDGFHKEMIDARPAQERNAFHHTTGKFERVFDQEDVDRQYGAFAVVRAERIEKPTTFFGKTYDCRHFWLVLQKP